MELDQILNNATFLDNIINDSIDILTDSELNQSNELTESTESNETESNETELSEIIETEIIELTENCINYELCKNKKNNNFDYCGDCFIYFYKKIEIINNHNSVCPICFSTNQSIKFIKLYECNHLICVPCIYNIYWDKTYLDNIPINPHPHLDNLWKVFLNTKIGRRVTCLVIYKLEHSYSNFDNYDDYIKKINIKRIPKRLVNNLKSLVIYQATVNKYLNEHNYQKYIMKKSIELCPYCRTERILN